MNELALFAGAGGGILGGLLTGWRTICAVEFDPYARSVLLARQRDGIIGRFPIWDDVRTFDGTRWQGRVDVVSGGFPCQDISISGKGAGLEGARSGLWGEMARVIREVRPQFVFVENSPMLASRGLGRVLGDLAEMGFNARWCVLGGFPANLCVDRKRMWILGARSNCERFFRPAIPHQVASEVAPPKRQFERAMGAAIRDEDHAEAYRDPDAMARAMDRFRAIGNGQVPAVAALAWEIMTAHFLHEESSDAE